MSYKDDTKIFKSISKHRVRCKCSHTIVMAKAERTICSFCGNWVYKTPQLEFKYKLKELMKGGNNE